MISDHIPNGNSNGSFDIFAHLRKLEPTKEKGKFQCPLCNEQNLSVNMTTGAYQCFNGCQNADIREWLSPWEKSERKAEAKRPKSAQEIEKIKEMQVIADEFKLDKQVKRTLREYQDGVISKIDAIAHVEAYARANGINEYTARMMLRERLKELEAPSLSEEEEVEAELLKLLEFAKINYPVQDVFHPALSEILLGAAKGLDCPVELLVLPFWSGVASVIGTKVWIERKTGFKQPCILWSAISALSGSKKSPAMNVVIDPLKNLQHKEAEKYKHLLEAYELEKQHFDGLPKDEKADTEPPRRPVMRSYFIDEATMEAIGYMHAMEPNKNGFLWAVDEVAGLFKGLDQYKGGKGNSQQRLLSLYDGGTVKIDRVGKDPVYIPKTAISIVGSIQPSILDKLIKDKEDGDGTWSRFDVWEVPKTRMRPSGYEYDASDVLTLFYENLDALPETTLVMTPEGNQLFDQYHTALGNVHFPSEGAINNYLAKQVGRCLRRIAILHCMDAAIEGIALSNVIPKTTVARGIVATESLVNHAVNKISTSVDGSLAEELRKIQEYCHRRSVVDKDTSVRDIKRNLSAFKAKDSKEIEAIFAKLSTMGLGFTSKGDRGSLIYRAYVSSEDVTVNVPPYVGNVGGMSVPTSVATSDTQQGLQPYVGNVGGKNQISVSNQITDIELNSEKSTDTTDISTQNHTQQGKQTTDITPTQHRHTDIDCHINCHTMPVDVTVEISVPYTPKVGDKVVIVMPAYKDQVGTIIDQIADSSYYEIALEDDRLVTIDQGGFKFK